MTLGFILVPSAVASPWYCYIPMVCEAKAAIDFASDPLGFLLQKLTEANLWFLTKLVELMQNTSKIDLTSPGFLQQYAIIFAASSIMTVALWLIAVAKRAVRGVSLAQAVGEAIGFLMLQFVVNAITPGAIALLLKVIDDVTGIFEPYAIKNFRPFLETVLKVLAANPSQGVGQLLTVNSLMLLSVLLMWVELLIRSAAIYVAVALGPIVNSALVDRDLWSKSKKWFAALFALGLSKPVLFALLGLGGAIFSDTTGNLSDSVSRTLVGALILFLAVFASATLYKWLPAFGDDMAALHHDRKAAQSSGPAAAVDGPAQHANRAMSTHIQDSLVSGKSAGSAGSVSAAGGKGAASSAVGRAGTASAKTAASGTGAGVAAAGPAAPVAAAKAGFDLAKAKVSSSPGMQGADASNGGAGQGQGSDPSGAPAAARARGTGSDPVVGSGGQSTRPSSQGAPASARSQPAGSGPVVGPAPAQGPPQAPSSPSAPSRPAPPLPPTQPSGGGAPIKPPTSKDK
ncbi:hypothetical protein GR130_38360 [Streptomyces sp. GS7]|nr:hypothetical protein GR130_38360 [Streptomyces sp. GS7]